MPQKQRGIKKIKNPKGYNIKKEVTAIKASWGSCSIILMRKKKKKTTANSKNRKSAFIDQSKNKIIDKKIIDPKNSI